MSRETAGALLTLAGLLRQLELLEAIERNTNGR